MKNILSAVIAIFVAFILVRLLFTLFIFSWKALFIIIFAGLTLIVAIPIYIIAKKSLKIK